MFKNKSTHKSAVMFRYVKKPKAIIPVKTDGENKDNEEAEKQKPKYFQKG